MSAIDPRLLQKLNPLRSLQPDAIEELVSAAWIENHPARRIIFQRNTSDDAYRFVVSGSVLLVDAQDRRRKVDASSPADPLSEETPTRELAITATEVSLLCMPRSICDALLAGNRPPDYAVEEMQASAEDPSEGLFYQLFADLVSERLELPSLPDIAVQVRTAVAEDDTGPADLARIIARDPAIAARLIQLANGSLYGGQSQVDSLQPAIVRLGSTVTREVVTAHALRAVFQSPHAALRARMTKLWAHSTQVAATAHGLAGSFRGFDREQALLAGLVHDIGAIPLITNSVLYPELTANTARLDLAIEKYRSQTGAMILRYWRFPDILTAVPMHAEDWYRQTSEPKPDYADLIAVSQLLCTVDGRAVTGERWPQTESTTAWQRLESCLDNPMSPEDLRARAEEALRRASQLLPGSAVE